MILIIFCWKSGCRDLIAYLNLCIMFLFALILTTVTIVYIEKAMSDLKHQTPPTKKKKQRQRRTPTKRQRNRQQTITTAKTDNNTQHKNIKLERQQKQKIRHQKSYSKIRPNSKIRQQNQKFKQLRRSFMNCINQESIQR